MPVSSTLSKLTPVRLSLRPYILAWFRRGGFRDIYCWELVCKSQEIVKIWQTFRGFYMKTWGHAVEQLVRNCPASRRFAGSIPYGVIGIFRWRNTSCRTIILRSTQSPKEVSATNISWWLMPPVRAAGNLTTFMCRCLEIWEPEAPGTLRASPGLYRDCFTRKRRPKDVLLLPATVKHLYVVVSSC